MSFIRGIVFISIALLVVAGGAHQGVDAQNAGVLDPSLLGNLRWRSIGPANEARFLNLLAGFERLRSLPTRFLTGTFVAIRAVRR